MKLNTNPMRTLFRIIMIAAFISVGISQNTWGQTTVTLYPDIDCLINNKSGYQDTSYPVTTAIRGYAWTESGTPTTQRSLIKFDLSSIPVDATITNATLTLYGSGHNPLTGSNASWLERSIEDWTETTATWNNQPLTTISGRISLPQSTTSTQDYPIDVTTFVQGWLDGSFANYGMKMRLQTESTYRNMQFASSDHATSSKHPKLEITYEIEEINHILAYTPNDEVTATSTLYTASKEVTQKDIQYQDGFDRTSQMIGVEATPSGKDLVRPMEYDRRGRVIKSYLPFAITGANDGAFVEDPTNPSNWTAHYGSTEDDYTFAETYYERSALNRVVKQGATGSQWQVSATHAIEKDYFTNNASEETVYLWNVSGGTIVKTRNYLDKELYVNETTDEEGQTIRSYTNNKGQTVITRTPDDASGNLYTYYVYDEFDRLRYTLPPKFIKDYDGGGAIATLLDNYAYQYSYDGNGRVIEKKDPGVDVDVEKIMYDQWDRVVLTQDGNQRVNDQWTFVKYDIMNRPIMTGTITDSRATSAIQASIDGALRFENTSATDPGYTLNLTFPTSATVADLLSVNYYDDYRFIGASYFTTGIDYDYMSGDFGASKYDEVKGLSTGSKEKILGQTTWLKSVVYYDDRLRPLQTISDNHLEGTDRVSLKYKNKVNSVILETKRTHNIKEGGQLTDDLIVHREQTYDHRNRPEKAYQTLSRGATTGTRVQVSDLDYDELGRVVEQNLHATDGGGTTFMQSVDFKYNIRNWLTHVNNGSFDTSESGADTDLFGMELVYDNNVSEFTTAPKYNGGISAFRWKVDDQVGAAKENIYAYTYTNRGQLQSASYAVKNGIYWDQDVGAYDVEGVAYDANGNLQSLIRWGKEVAQVRAKIDDIDYSTYSGNQLTKAEDAVSGSAGFTNGVSSATEFQYDANGNIKQDDNAGISSVTHNLLDLPQQITYAGGSVIDFMYGASGSQLQKKVTQGSSVSTMDYIGGIQYVDEGFGAGRELAFVQTPEGRVLIDGTDFNNEYWITDHLGNLRVAFTENEVVDSYTATMETENDTEESAIFSNLDTRVVSVAANHTSGGNEASRLNNTQPIGPAMSLAVQPGDEIDLEVYAYYEGGSGYDNSHSLATMVTGIAAAFGGISGGGGEAQVIYDAIDAGMAIMGLGGNNQSTVPSAYLNYLLFDENLNYIQGGYQAISSAANFSKQLYSLNTITIDQPGFIFVYVSNESDVSNWVYFDDLKVTSTKNTVSQVAHYYPFGMTMDGALQSFGYSGGKGNKYLFNGMELNEELDQYSTGYRMYNPALGRFNGVDPVAGKYGSISPYNFAFNDPVYWSDPSGADPNREQANQRYSDPYDPWSDWSSAPGYLGYTQSGWGHIGPGSGNHWSDAYRSVEGNFMLMSTSTFRDFYGLNDGYGGTNYDRAGALADALAASGNGYVTRYSVGVNGPGDGNGNIIPGMESYHLYVDDQSNEGDQDNLRFHSSFSWVNDGHVRIEDGDFGGLAGQHVRVEITNNNIFGTQLRLQDQSRYTIEKTLFGLSERKVYHGDLHTFNLFPGQTKTFDFYRFDYSPMTWQFGLSAAEINEAINIGIRIYSTWVPGDPIDPRNPFGR